MKTFKPLTHNACTLAEKISAKYNGEMPPSLLERRLFTYIAGCASCNAFASLSKNGEFSIRYARSIFLPIFLDSAKFAATPLDLDALRAHLARDQTMVLHNVNAFSASPEGKQFIAHFGYEITSVHRSFMAFYDETDVLHLENMRSASNALLEVYKACLNFIPAERRDEIISLMG